MTKTFADFWDALAHEDAARGRAETVMRFIREHRSDARCVLELGVGNGNVLKHFTGFERYGLDVNERFVALAREKSPDGVFLVESMHAFSFDKRFDVVYSVYDSINYLEEFEEWESTFERVADHLEDHGLFIFDMYTPLVLERERGSSSFSREPFGYLGAIGEVVGDSLTWYFTIFERVADGFYERVDTVFRERVFSIECVESVFLPRFEIIEKLDGESFAEPSSDTVRMLYVLRKRS